MPDVVQESLARDFSVREVLVPHPQVVTETSRRLLDEEEVQLAGRRARRESTGPGNGAVEHGRFHPVIYQRALDLAGGDVQRLLAHSLKDIEVLNKPRPRNTDIWGRRHGAVGNLES